MPADPVDEGQRQQHHPKLAQDLAGKHFYRPRLAEAAAKYQDRFPEVPLVTIDEFGGWHQAQATHFADGGVFDQIYQPGQ